MAKEEELPIYMSKLLPSYGNIFFDDRQVTIVKVQKCILRAFMACFMLIKIW